MQTKILTQTDLKIAAEILENGGLVSIPTETVYGLAANALDGEAVKKIFEAKGRPSDNPLIVHISNIKMLNQLVKEIPENARKLISEFWPGPLTVILPAKSIVPREVSAGLSTVAIRMPNHPVAIDLIDKCGFPLAAPSANLSGSPSPTSSKHVVDDLDGKIDAIIDGGKCSVGLESTVITFTTKTPRILRPGGITKDQISSVIGEVEIDPAVLEGISIGDKVESPGMKYKHYSPRSKLVLLKGSCDSYVKHINGLRGKNNMALCFDEDKENLNVKAISYGSVSDYRAQAATLFDALRKLDSYSPDVIYAHCPEPIGVGMAVYNRLIRAAGFEVIEVE